MCVPITSGLERNNHETILSDVTCGRRDNVGIIFGRGAPKMSRSSERGKRGGSRGTCHPNFHTSRAMPNQL